MCTVYLILKIIVDDISNDKNKFLLKAKLMENLQVIYYNSLILILVIPLIKNIEYNID